MDDSSICHVKVLFQNGSYNFFLDVVETSLFKVLTHLLGADDDDLIDCQLVDLLCQLDH
jgi:hypothetical protein